MDRLFCRALSSAQGPVEQCGDKPFPNFRNRLSQDPAISSAIHWAAYSDKTNGGKHFMRCDRLFCEVRKRWRLWKKLGKRGNEEMLRRDAGKSWAEKCGVRCGKYEKLLNVARCQEGPTHQPG